VMLSSPEDEVIVGDPSFVRYDAAAHLTPCKLIKVPLDSNYRHDLSAMAARVTSNTKMVFVANPNNPTGTVVGRREVDAFLRDVPSDVLLVLDEAYFEFAEHLEDYPASTLYLDRPNVAGLRTFSKTHGLAGIRVGYGFVPEWLSDAIDRAREPFDVNALAQVAGIAALSDTDHVRNTLENNARGMKRLNEFLLTHGARPVESYANFVLADFGRPARPLFDQLLRQGVIVRPGDVLGCPNCLRISIGTDEEMTKLLSALEQSMGAAV
jgi:histidinol-phosphate aminotransferase